MLSRALNDLRLPVMVSPMFLASGVELVSACCRSGVVGTLPAHNARDSQEFGCWLRQIGDSVCEVEAPGPLAVNLNVNKARMQRLDADLKQVVENRVAVVVTSVGDPRDVVDAVHSYGGLVFHDITNVHHAEKAIEAGVDGLILVCAGAGGHSGALSPFALVPHVRKLFNGYVVLGGAISDGASIRAAQMLGADLVYMGTRFLATQESSITQDYKELLMSSRTEDVMYTSRISGVNANFLRTSIRHRGLDPDNLPEIHNLYRQPEGMGLPKPWVDLWSAGQGVGLIDDLPTVEALVSRLESEYLNAELPLANSSSKPRQK